MQKPPPRTERRILRGGTSNFSDLAAKVFAVLILFLSTEALIGLTTASADFVAPNDPLEGNPVREIVWLGIYGVVFLLILGRWRQFTNAAMRDKLLVLLVVIAFLSVLWSAAPEITVRRIVALAGTTMIGMYFASRYDVRELLGLLAWAIGIAAVLSLVFSLALPSYGIDPGSDDGSWRGIYPGGKNALGRNMALGALVFLLWAISARSYRWAAWVGLGLSLALLLLANSVTSLVTFLLVLVLLLPYASLRWSYTLAVPTFMLATLASIIAIMWFQVNAGTLLQVLGRDTTLTNRTELWPAVLEMIARRPWLGYGYGAFWLGWAGESAQIWHWSQDVDPVHAHNGFLDLWLHLGLVGLTTFLVGFLLTIRRAARWVRLTSTADGLFPLAFLTFLIPYNLSESAILANNNVLWILYVAIAIRTVVRPSEDGKGAWTFS